MKIRYLIQHLLSEEVVTTVVVAIDVIDVVSVVVVVNCPKIMSKYRTI